MKYNLTEEKILKKLGIPDFRYMTKDKVVRFVTMMPHMDPTVAKAAIDKFPEFKDMAIQMTDSLKEMADKAFKSASESQKYFYDACNNVIETLKIELTDDHIDASERERIENHMLQIIYLMGQKDSEHKRFVSSTVQTVAFVIGTIGTAAAAAIGITTATRTGLPSISDDSINNNSDYTV